MFWGSLQIWNALEMKNFITSTKPMKIRQVKKNLSAYFLLPKEIAIIKAEHHSKHQDPEPHGNVLADHSAAGAAEQVLLQSHRKGRPWRSLRGHS